MFDLKWYNKLLRLVAAAITPVTLIAMSTAQCKSDTSYRKEKARYNEEVDENIINYSFYFEDYLNYFNLEFKNILNPKVTNKQIGCWTH